MPVYEFAQDAGHRLGVPLDLAHAEDAAARLKERLEELGLTYDHFRITVESGKVIVAGDAAVREQKEKILLALGNVVGVSCVEDQVQTGQETDGTRFVTVRPGESLTDMARRIYGDPSAAPGLLRANSPLLAVPEDARPGLVLRAPM